MNVRFRLSLAAVWLAASAAALAQEAPPPTPTPTSAPEPQATPAPEPPPAPSGPTSEGVPPLQASNILNPNISLVGNFVGFAGNDRTLPSQAWELSEVELGLQAAIDPYSRADVFIAFSAEGVDVEEAYVTWLTLPGSLSLRAGKFRTNFGKFNPIHPPETPFANRPLAAQRFFGEEGLTTLGLSASYLLPTPFYLNLDVEAGTNFKDAPLFGEESESGEIISGGRRADLGYVTRLSTYADFSETTNGIFGLSWAHGVHDPEGLLSSDILGFDATIRWKNPRRAIYRSFIWQTEVYYARRSEADGSEKAWGAFSYAEYQFARRWRAGLRGDYVQEPSEKGGLAYLTFWSSEFSALSLQGSLVRRPDGRNDLGAFLKLTFNIGPHGAHPF
jgi:hypothetical protein